MFAIGSVSALRGRGLAFRGLSGRIRQASFIFGLTLILASCGGSSPGSSQQSTIPAPTATLKASPTVIFPAQHVTLTWASTNGTQGSINNNLGAVGLNGSTQIDPSATTTYTYTVTGPGGTATATATVTVDQITVYEGIDQTQAAANPGTTISDDVDANGAIGTKQYLEYVNTSLQAYDKATGNPVWATPEPIANLWPSGSACNTVSSGTNTQAIQLDVDVTFDRLASRWVVGAKTSNGNPPQGYTFCLAVSSTDDLSSASLKWITYETDPDYLNSVLGQNSSSVTYFPDWPKIATWTDASGSQSAYFATMDLEDPSNAYTEVGVVACAFNRTDLLTSGTGSQTCESADKCTCQNISDLTNPTLSSNGTYLAHSLIPADIDGTTVPPAGRDEYMVSILNPTIVPSSTTSSNLNLWDVHVNWTVTPPFITAVQSPLPVTTFTPGCYLYDTSDPTITNCVSEPQSGGNPQLIDSVGDRLMPRFAYRNFGSYESYLISQTVQTGPGTSGTGPLAYQTGIRWYELRDNGAGAPTVDQSGTINPDSSYFRFLPSIAQDKTGNVAVGYSVSNPFVNPQIDFSYWNLSSTATPNELLIFQGPGEEITATPPYAGKWGSYSSMTVDPTDDCTFWYVNEYFASDDTWHTKLTNFKVPGCQ